MREEEGARYLSPLVKQDLAKLDTDGDTRRLAVKSLRMFVDQLDATTLPRFISQIADSREPGATRCYAISLYEEAARVHGKLMVPHISKVMAALVRSSSASGTFPQLQVACARVTAAIARHGIDATTSEEEAERIMREICNPLIDALAGKLEPVASTSAACLHALAETDKWKHAREKIVHEVCLRTTVALGEKSTRTAAHMQLIRILASVNPDVLCLHGASLLRAGEEILKGTTNSWQLRKAAAQLLQSVLTILDKETLQTELNSALHTLEGYRLDRMPHVRTAVSEALHTAKMLASGSTGMHTSFGMAASPIRKSPGSDRSPWLHDVPVSPATSKRGASPMSPGRASPRGASPTSQESRLLSISSTSTSTSESAHVPRSPARNGNKGGTRAMRAPLYPTRASLVHSPRTPGTSCSSSTTTVEECESPSRLLNMKEFNGRTVSNGLVYSRKDKDGHGQGRLKVQIEEVDVAVPATKDSSPRIRPSGEEFESARLNSAHVEVVLPRLKLGSLSSLNQQLPETPIVKASSIQTSDSEVEERIVSSQNEQPGTADVEVEKRQIVSSAESQPGSLLQHFYKPLSLDVEFPEKSAECLLPKRLVRSLSNLSTPGSVQLAHEDEGDAETASETGWSVRDNPIASEDSYRLDSSDDDDDCRGMLENGCSPRDIRMLSPIKAAPSPDNEDDDHPCPSCVVTDAVKVLCTDTPGSGLSSLLHEDEINPPKSTPSEEDAGLKSSNRCNLMSRVKQFWGFAETALGGSLCFIIAVPLAILFVKGLHGRQDELYDHLVPT